MWKTGWREIAEKIDRFEHAVEIFFKVTGPLGSDYHGLSNDILIPGGRALYKEIKTFQEQFQSDLPAPALVMLDNLVKKGSKVDRDPSGLNGLAGIVSVLSMIRNTVESYVSDPELSGKRLIERAFLHLQRLIVADEHIRTKWQGAFAHGEPACEALGGCHLLLHGIWGFKVSAEGERTDLVLGDQFHISAPMRQAAEAMALTEWKKAISHADALKKAKEARQQAELYSRGVLAGFEIRSVRYLVVVSGDRVSLPDDIIERGITYRHINVAVDPASPSVAART